MSDQSQRPTTPFGRFFRVAWPAFVPALMVVLAVWHVVDFPDDVDGEFPGVIRPTFNRMPPPAYRLAEPGDTLDRVGLYLSAGAAVLSSIGLIRAKERRGYWVSSLTLSLAAAWYSSTPGPTFDGWHGLGWRLILDSGGPTFPRVLLASAAMLVCGIVVLNLVQRRGRLAQDWADAKSLGLLRLLGFSAVCVVARQFEIPGVEPVGYWPRWAFLWGMSGFLMAIIKAILAQGLPGRLGRVVWTTGAIAAWMGLVVLGIDLSWYHRPLSRLRTVEDGKIYISAMPTYRGLKVAHDRLQFKTIINIFPEDTSQRSPRLPEEHRFVREHGIRYVEASAEDNDSEEFMALTMKLARDPEAWPILLHCHGCMDRSPAWMGIYRFVYQARSLDAILKEIEGHRGYRPKASITLLFNRVLPRLAPDRYRDDPTAELLRKNAQGRVSIPRSQERASITRKGEPTPSR